MEFKLRKRGPMRFQYLSYFVVSDDDEKVPVHTLFLGRISPMPFLRYVENHQ